MKNNRRFLGMIFLSLTFVACSYAQTENPPSSPTAPSNLLVLVHQEFKFGKESSREKLEVSISRACDHLTVPNSWIDLQSITGRPEALSFDPFDSFEQIDSAFVAWGQLFTSHPELARMQEEIRALESAERTIIAVRRDDLSYRAASIDLSKARFMRVLEVRLRPGHESDFVEAFKTLSAAYEKISADLPWVVYQVNVGMPSPSFVVFVPMHGLQQNDDLLGWRKSLREAEGEEGAQRMQQIARDAYASTESNLYAVSPGTSHVSKEFAAGDPDFWSSKPSPPASKPKESKTSNKSAGRKGEGEKP